MSPIISKTSVSMIKMSSFKSSEDIQKKEDGLDRFALLCMWTCVISYVCPQANGFDPLSHS